MCEYLVDDYENGFQDCESSTDFNTLLGDMVAGRAIIKSNRR